MILDETNQELISKNKKIELTPNEFKFMQFIIKNKNRNCTYKELIMYIYNVDEESYVYFKSPLRTIIKRIRKKIKGENLEIITIHDYGIFIRYKIDDEEKKIIKKFKIELEISQLENEIAEKRNKIKSLKESLK